MLSREHGTQIPCSEETKCAVSCKGYPKENSHDIEGGIRAIEVYNRDVTNVDLVSVNGGAAWRYDISRDADSHYLNPIP